MVLTGLGSPPRVRGIDLAAIPLHPGDGITPARAGNRCVWPVFCTYLQDHPRACGE